MRPESADTPYLAIGIPRLGPFRDRRTAARRPGRASAWALVVGFAGAFLGTEDTWAGDPRVFRDHARVIEVRPIADTSRRPFSSGTCEEYRVVRRWDGSTDGDRSRIAGTIGEDIRRQNQVRRLSAAQACEAEPTRGPTHLGGVYEVTYRYRGRTFKRRLDQYPGLQLPIEVQVEPLD